MIYIMYIVVLYIYNNRLESLDKTLDYSHHNAPPPPGASVGDEADNGRAKVYIPTMIYGHIIM